MSFIKQFNSKSDKISRRKWFIHKPFNDQPVSGIVKHIFPTCLEIDADDYDIYYNIKYLEHKIINL